MPLDVINPRICFTNNLKISNKVCPTFAQQESNQVYMVFLNREIYSCAIPTNMMDLWTNFKFQRFSDQLRGLCHVTMLHFVGVATLYRSLTNNIWNVSVVILVKYINKFYSESFYTNTAFIDHIIFRRLNAQTSEAHEINAVVPQGSLLGLTRFLLVINDMPRNIISSLVNINADIYHCLWTHFQKTNLIGALQLISPLTQL